MVIIINKITPTIVITKTTKLPPIKPFLYFIDNIYKEDIPIIYSFAENISIYIWFMTLLQRKSLCSFEAPGTVYKRLQKLSSFNNATLIVCPQAFTIYREG